MCCKQHYNKSSLQLLWLLYCWRLVIIFSIVYKHTLADKERDILGVNDENNDTYICGVLRPSTCGNHNILGSQDRLYERGGKFWSNGRCSYPSKNKEMSNESKWSPQYSALRWWQKHFKIIETSNKYCSQ